jgi:hypothetical protein
MNLSIFHSHCLLGSLVIVSILLVYLKYLIYLSLIFLNILSLKILNISLIFFSNTVKTGFQFNNHFRNELQGHCILLGCALYIADSAKDSGCCVNFKFIIILRIIFYTLTSFWKVIIDPLLFIILLIVSPLFPIRRETR